METLKDLVRKQDKARAAHEKQVEAAVAAKRFAEAQVPIKRLRAAVHKFLTLRNSLAERRQEPFGERSRRPDTDEELVSWYLCTQSDVRTGFAVRGRLFEDGSVYLYARSRGLFLANDALLQRQDAAIIERLTAGVDALQWTLEQFIRGAANDNPDTLRATLQFEVEMTSLWYIAAVQKQPLIYGSHVAVTTQKGREDHLRWYFNSPAFRDETFTGSGFVQSDDSLYVLHRNGQYLSVPVSTSHLSPERLVALRSAVVAIRQPQPCSTEDIEELRTEIAATLQWCREVLEEGIYICGSLAVKPGTDDMLVRWNLWFDQLTPDEVPRAGRLYSDGTIYLEVAGTLQLIDEQMLRQQPLEAARLIINGVKNVRSPVVRLEITGRTE